MNRDQLTGNWKQIRGKVQGKWGKLTDDDLDQINGQREPLVGRIQEQYGKSKGVAEKEEDDYINRL